MSGEVRTWEVGPRVCRMAVSVSRAGALVPGPIEWLPDRPARLSRGEWAQFRAGRAAALAELAAAYGREVVTEEG